MISFYSIGTVQSYTQSLKSKNLWEQRKQNGYYEQLAEEDPDRASWQERIDEMNSKLPDREMDAIINKLNLGKKLTAAEKQKLCETNPELYQKARELEAEQERYEKAIRRCKTKEEVQRLRLQRLNSSAHAIKSAETNPAISGGAKMGIAQNENRRVNACNDAHNRFSASGEYAKLPTEAEVARERRKKRLHKGGRRVITIQVHQPPAQKDTVTPPTSWQTPSTENQSGEVGPVDEKKPGAPEAARPPEQAGQTTPATPEAQRAIDSYRRAVATGPSAERPADWEKQVFRKKRR